MYGPQKTITTKNTAKNKILYEKKEEYCCCCIIKPVKNKMNSNLHMRHYYNIVVDVCAALLSATLQSKMRQIHFEQQDLTATTRTSTTTCNLLHSTIYYHHMLHKNMRGWINKFVNF